MFPIQGNQPDDGKLYVDDVFSTFLYQGNGSTQTINNGIDLAGKGGLVWIKNRNSTFSHTILDTARPNVMLDSTSTGAQGTGWTWTPNSNGFGVGFSDNRWNGSSYTYASWTFRKAPKFFDVVTYTGNGVLGRQIAHNLGVAPGMIVVKKTSVGGDQWWVYHRSLGGTQYIQLNNTEQAAPSVAPWNNTEPTDSVFTVDGIGGYTGVNESGASYVAYLFAHDTSADGIIQCGCYSGAASEVVTILGWEPQFLMVKCTNDRTSHWVMMDSSRGLNAGGMDAVLAANLSAAESSFAGGKYLEPRAAGFAALASSSTEVSSAAKTFIYLAIRRPNKPPTLGTQVYNAIARTGTGSTATVTGVGFAPDVAFGRWRSDSTWNSFVDKLRGPKQSLNSTATNSEFTSIATQDLKTFEMDGVTLGGDNATSFNAAAPVINHFLRRAPGFFDVVCYTGTGVAHTVPHSLGVAPELMIVKNRSAAISWVTYDSFTGATNRMLLDSTAATGVVSANWNNTTPTSSVFTVGTGSGVNGSAENLVAYLFATKAGISKVGSFTGNGSSQTINCGFSTGARFILIKRTNNTGDWYIWDTARGIISANDPHLSLNTTAAEVTTDDSVDPDVSGFIVNQVAATNINVTGASYIFLAIS